MISLLRRRRAPSHLERTLRVRRRWRVEARVATSDWLTLPVTSWQLSGVIDVETDVPASGPELELGFEVPATVGEIAERLVERRLERLGLSVLAIRSKRA